MLGSVVESALATVGITPERVEAWVGYPCGCKERKEKLDQLSRWAIRVVSGKVERASEYLRSMMDE